MLPSFYPFSIFSWHSRETVNCKPHSTRFSNIAHLHAAKALHIRFNSPSSLSLVNPLTAFLHLYFLRYYLNSLSRGISRHPSIQSSPAFGHFNNFFRWTYAQRFFFFSYFSYCSKAVSSTVKRFSRRLRHIWLLSTGRLVENLTKNGDTKNLSEDNKIRTTNNSQLEDFHPWRWAKQPREVEIFCFNFSLTSAIVSFIHNWRFCVAHVTKYVYL